MNSNAPIPENELARLIELAEFDLDYTNMDDQFKDLTKLAAKVAGTEISLINLLDHYSQWTIAEFGHSLGQGPREDSVCQYTILGSEPYEIKSLPNDERFKDKDYVTGDPNFHYYFGIPLRTEKGHNLGALCVLDTKEKQIDAEKIELLKIIAKEIVHRLSATKAIQELKGKVKDARDKQKRVAHDIRGPLGGIINLAEIISLQGDENKMEEVLEFISLIHKSGRSILDLADEILSSDRSDVPLKSSELNLLSLRDKLHELYALQAKNKGIDLSIDIDHKAEEVPFSKNKLIQITGNLISNALKFTPCDGKVSVELSLQVEKPHNILLITVRDSGIGLDAQSIEQILSGNAASTEGTTGEQGYGFGLALVKHLTESLKGKLAIESEPGKGAVFSVQLPQVKC